MKIKIFVVLLISLFQANIHAEVGKWEYYRAYWDASIVAETPHLVFAVCNGSLFSYNPADNEIKLYSTQTGLSDVDIQHMVYSPKAKALVLVYENANIDIFAGEDEIYNLPFIKNNMQISDKTIYNLEIIGEYAYISTSFGILVVDIVRKEVKDRYNLDVVTRSVCLWDDYLYAATNEGIKRASVSSNLLDKKNWETFEDLNDPNNSNIKKIFVFKDTLVFQYTWNYVHYLPKSGGIGMLSNKADVRQIAVINDKLVIVSPDEIAIYSDISQEPQRFRLDILSIDCNNPSERYWVGLSDGKGLAAINIRDNAVEYEVTGITVDSPKRNLNFFMTFTAGKLLIVGGGRNSNRLNTPGTLMVYENGRWTNFDENEIAEETKIEYCKDFMSVAVDPEDPNHYFVASWGEGVFEFKNNEWKNYTDTNTNGKIQSSVTGEEWTPHFFRIDGLVYDRNGNLYMVNANLNQSDYQGNTPYALVEFSANKQWKNYPVEFFMDGNGGMPNQILIDGNNYKWLNSWGNPTGLVVLDENNQQIGFSNTFKDQTGSDIGVANYLCLAEALDGTVWVGTDNGPIQFTSHQQVENGECYRLISYDEYDKAFYPLENEKINAIAIDGGNRKWLASETSGVFLAYQIDTLINNAHTGVIKIENFNTSNSPILSDKVNSIAIDNATGEVFIGTDKGLCSYMSHVTPGKTSYSSDVHAFPNPVRPDAGEQVSITGLMQNSTVKITDAAGNLINQGQSTGSLYTWNCINRSGETVKAGVYLVFASSSAGDQGIVTKIMVIK